MDMCDGVSYQWIGPEIPMTVWSSGNKPIDAVLIDAVRKLTASYGLVAACPGM